MRDRLSWIRTLAAVGLLVAGAGLTADPAMAAVRHRVGSLIDVSSACRGQNAEVEQAVDVKHGYIYEEWMGCGGIGFARSLNGGLSFQPPITLPQSTGSNAGSWDPALAVAPNGTVYAGFMTGKDDRTFPVVAASIDGGATFPQTTSLPEPNAHDWGDRDFLAVAPDGALYVTRDFGPDASSVTFICFPTGSCSFATGQLNAVMQKSPRSAVAGEPLRRGSQASSARLLSGPATRSGSRRSEPAGSC